MAANPLSGLPAFIGRFLGNAISEAAGFALGSATSDVLKPRLQTLKNSQNQDNPHIPPEPGAMAEGAAKGQVAETTAAFYAKQLGLGDDQFAQLLAAARSGPPLSSAYEAWRRAELTDAEFLTALKRTGLEDTWQTMMQGLKDVWLSPAQIALGIVRSLIPDPGLMPVDLDTSGGTVPAYKQSTIDALKEALGAGIDEERLRVLVGEIGLPMSTQQAANAYFRNQISLGDYHRSILEGDVRPEWADAILAQARQYPSVHEFIENRIRGWSDDAAMNAGTAKHGMSAADTLTLFQNAGRPPSAHQVFIGLRRGGVYNGPTTGIDPAVLKAMEESSIRPEWYNIVAAGLETLPAAFVLRALTQAGDVTEAESNTLLLDQGWPVALAATVSAKWAGGTGTTAAQKKQTLSHLTDEYLSGALTRAALVTALTALGYTAAQANDEINLAEFNASKAVRTKATTAIGKRYIALQLTQAQAEADMLALGWPQGAVDKYVAGWNAERDDEGTTLTKAQVVKAAKLGTLSQADAATRLEELGVSAPDAAIILADA